MRALLVVHDSHTRGVIESVLEARGWDLLSAHAADEALLLQRGHPATLVIAEEDAEGSAAWLFGSIRRHRGGNVPHLLAWLPDPNEGAAVRRLAEVAASDLAIGPLDEADWESRIAWIGARIAAGTIPSVTGRADSGAGEFEREFHVQQAFLEGLFEGAPEGVVILDAEDRVVRINGEFSRLFGYSPEEVRGQPLNDLIVPDDLRKEGVEIDGGVRRGERVMIETMRRHKDGHLIDVSVLARHIEVNGPVGAFGIYRDITETKRRDAALRESEERYRALFDQSPVGVLLCDGNLRITHCNESLTRIVGATYEELVGAHLVSLRDRRLIPGLRAALRGKPASYEGPYRSRSGRQRHVSIQYAPLRDDQGVVIGGMGVLEDTSDRVMAEQQRRAQAAEVERVNAALRERTLELEAAMQGRNRLYTAMNHELRTPISAILLYQELLIAGSLGPLAEDQLRALEHSHTATRHLLDLVRDILDLSKIEAGKVSYQPAEICLRTVLDELHAAVVPLTERYGSQLTLVVEEDFGTVVTDPQRLRQILLNFVSNAAKYGRRQPIEIRARRGPLEELVIEIIDGGIGIARDDLKQIFEDFVQLGSAKDEGTGLGLAISRRLADLLGARVEVESELGRGSTFRLVLPPGVFAGVSAGVVSK